MGVFAGCDPYANLVEGQVPTGDVPAEARCDLDGDLTACAAGGNSGNTRCKRGLDNYYHASAAGSDIYRAHVYTSWCYRDGSIKSRNSRPTSGVTDVGWSFGYRDRGSYVHTSGCNNVGGTVNENCLTRFQFGFIWEPAPYIPPHGACIATRIYGNGSHSRNAYGGNCNS
jgi:hypothetical protein